MIKVKTESNKKHINKTGKSNNDFGEITSLTVPYDLVVSGPNHYVYLVTDEEVGVLKKLYKFDKNNIRMWC